MLRGFLCKNSDTPSCVYSREDFHPWARSPFTYSPFLTLGKRFIGPLPPTRLLQTSYDVRARLSSAILLARNRKHEILTEIISFLRLQMSVS